MPILLLDDLRSAVAGGVDDFQEQCFSAHNQSVDSDAELLFCPESQDFMTHIDHAAFLVDKSLIMTEFIGSWKPLVEVYNKQNMSVKSGSSLKRELNEEEGTQRKRVLFSDVHTRDSFEIVNCASAAIWKNLQSVYDVRIS